MVQALTYTTLLFIAVQWIVKGAVGQCGTCTSGKVFPNPDNPYSYYKCDEEKNCIFSECPAGTWFNASSAKCDMDPGYDKLQAGQRPYWNVDFAIGGNWWKQSSTTTSTSILSPTDESNSTSSGNEVKPVTQGKCDSKGPIFYRNSEDCSTFFTCLEGKFVLTKCPSQMYYNPTRFRCESSLPSECELTGSKDLPKAANNVH